MTKGHWVKFDADAGAYPGAQRSADGKVVGLLIGAGFDSATGAQVPATINVVAQDRGHNLIELVDGEVRLVTVDPTKVPFVRADIPADCPIERVRHLVPAEGE